MSRHVKGQPTRAAQKAATIRQRDKWRRLGYCTRCGGDKEGPRYAWCQDCRTTQAVESRNRYLQLKKQARTLGLSVRQLRQARFEASIEPPSQHSWFERAGRR